MKWYKHFIERINDKNSFSWVALFVIIVLTCIIYKPSLNYGFISNWDDNINVTQNKYITEFSSKSIATLFDMNEPIPEPRFVWFTYMLDYHFFKLEPSGYHIHNLIWHLINILLIFLLSQLIFKNKITSLFISMIFALHPMNIEAIVWITGRKDLIFTSFYLASIIIYIRYNTKSKHPFWFILVLFLAYMASLSKIQSLTLPMILILIDWYKQRKLDIYILIEKIIIIWLLWINASHLNLLSSVLMIPLSYYILEYINSKKSKPLIALILICIFVFTGLKINFLTEITLVISLFFVVQLIIKKISTFSIIKLNRSIKRLILIGTLFLVIIVSYIIMNNTVIGYLIERGLNFDKYSITDRLFMASYSVSHYIIKFFVPFGHSVIQPYPLKVDGFLPILYYISPLFILTLACFGYYKISKSHYPKRDLIFFIFFFLITISPVLHLIPIYGHLITADRYSYLSYLGLLGLTIIIFRNLEIKMKYRPVLLAVVFLYLTTCTLIRIPLWKNEKVLFDQVIKKHPDFSLAYNNRGFWYYNRGNFEEAKKDFSKAVALDSNNIVGCYNLSLIYANESDYYNAIKTLNKIEGIDKYIDGIYLRAYCLKKTEQFYPAIQDFNRLLELEPKHFFGLYNRGTTYYSMGDYNNAIHDYHSVLAIQPKFHQAYDAMGNAYLMSGNYDSSLICFDIAISMESNIADYYINKAECLIRMGKTKEACTPLQEALKRNHPRANELLKVFCK